MRRWLVLLIVAAFVPQAWSQAGIESDSPGYRGAGRLTEVAPRITLVEVKKGDPFLEVFITGLASLDCYDVREYSVEKADVLTRIIPRFRRSKPEAACNTHLKVFREKAADLDGNSAASARVDVLGYDGWHSEKVSAATLLSVTAPAPGVEMPPSSSAPIQR